MTYKFDVVVRYAETDRMSITHHSVYPIWFEEARSNWIKSRGMTYQDVEQRGVLMPLVDLHCHYYGSCDYMDHLTVLTQITKLTCSRINFKYLVYKQDTLITQGSTDHAWVDKSSFKPINIKKVAPDIYNLMKTAMES